MKRKLVAVLAALALLSACGPPEQLNREADTLPGQIKSVREQVATAESSFGTRLNDAKYAFLKTYEAQDRHEGNFASAKLKLDEADKTYNEKVKAVIGAYSDSRQAELETGIKDVRRLKDEATTLSQEPFQWIDKVVIAKDNAPKLTADAKAAFDNLNTRHAALAADMNGVKAKYAKQTEAVDRLMKPFNDRQATTATAFGNMQTEVAKPKPNYAVVAEYSEQITKNQAAFATEEANVRVKLGELPRSESQTLLDLRVDSSVIINRTSWDEDSDWTTDKDYEYPPVFVEPDTANHFAQFGPETVLASDSHWAFGGFKTEGTVDRGHWDKLGIDPRKDWPDGSHDHAEFFGEIEDVFCHKLFVLVNGKPDSSGRPEPSENYCAKYDNPADVAKGIYWVEADELNADAVGMDILSKAAGDFNDQMVEDAAPPGMAYVGDPQFGNWQTDSNGNSFWVFYGQFRLFSDLIGGPNPYHYGYEYDEWNKKHRYNGSAYFAHMGSAPRYGAQSPMAAARFNNTQFGKSGLAAQAKDPSARNAGPVARAGGPGGGGK
ncbi:MAG TPA: hypothetical protein VFZ48_03480 [Candidatus Saccharimonadales bacterium]